MLGEDIYKLNKEIVELKGFYNQIKILLGGKLNEMNTIYEEETFDGNNWFNEDDGTFNQYLASIHLNPRRANPLMWNAKYLEELEMGANYYPQLDSSVIEMCKKVGKNPLEYVHLSYSDIKKEIK